MARVNVPPNGGSGSEVETFYIPLVSVFIAKFCFSYPTTIRHRNPEGCGSLLRQRQKHHTSCVGSEKFSPLLSRTKNTIFVSFTAFSQRKLLLFWQEVDPLDLSFWSFFTFFAPWYRKSRGGSCVKIALKKFKGTVGQMSHRTSDQTVLGSNPTVAAALSPWTRLFTPIVPRRSLYISVY